MAISDKLNYLIETKQLFKDRLNSLGAEIIKSTTFRNYLNWLDTFYNQSSDKTDLAKNGVVGRTSQDGNPTPENPVEINNLSGDVEYKVRGQGISESFPLSLGDIELCKIGDYQDSIKKSTGKNLFDKNNANVLNGMFINAVVGNIGSNANATSIYIPINPNTTYCVSKTKGNRFAIGYSSTTPAVNVSLTNIVADRTKTSLTSTSSSDSKYLVIYISLSDTETYENIISTIQIEYGNTPTDFEPYGKVWYLNKQIGKVVLNGSKNWTKSGNTNIDRFVLSGYVDYGDTNCFSNYFANETYSDSNYNKSKIFLNTYSNTKRLIINFNTVGTTSLSNFKTWLSTHNTIVYYVLATPTTTEITQENYPTLYSQLLAIQEFLTKYKINKEFLLDYSSPEIEY